ncbi:endonuclease domain-containing protein [Streptomyces sp. NPDC012508]|uniref:endonuclease domain-containing protein n=1 Tax=Streptomyces sp. NPDC012508 TaxID=3364837 RepID=UPI0036946E93
MTHRVTGRCGPRRPHRPVTARYRACARAESSPEADVDHRHEPGRVRDVPCFNCNAANGMPGDEPGPRRAISSLEGHAWKPTLVAPGVYQLPS